LLLSTLPASALSPERGRLRFCIGNHRLRAGLCAYAQRHAAACGLLQKDATQIFGGYDFAVHDAYFSDSLDHTGGPC
jgi:hypothetical protein